jgi:hypothetical protein
MHTSHNTHVSAVLGVILSEYLCLKPGILLLHTAGQATQSGAETHTGGFISLQQPLSNRRQHTKMHACPNRPHGAHQAEQTCYVQQHILLVPHGPVHGDGPQPTHPYQMSRKEVKW